MHNSFDRGADQRPESTAAGAPGFARGSTSAAKARPLTADR